MLSTATSGPPLAAGNFGPADPAADPAEPLPVEVLKLEVYSLAGATNHGVMPLRKKSRTSQISQKVK